MRPMCAKQTPSKVKPSRMKAWFVWVDDEWGDYVHGNTRSEAKAMMWRYWSLEVDEWVYMRALHTPRLDDIPITSKTILDGYDAEQQKEYDGYWHPICKCELCLFAPVYLEEWGTGPQYYKMEDNHDHAANK